MWPSSARSDLARRNRLTPVCGTAPLIITRVAEQTSRTNEVVAPARAAARRGRTPLDLSSLGPAQILSLQRTAGNAAVGRMLATQRHEVRRPRVSERAPRAGAVMLQRAPSCRRLLGTDPRRRRTGPRVSESSVSEFLAEELERVGTVERELPIPGGTAAPWRTDRSDSDDDTLIDPQIIAEGTRGSADIAMMVDDPALELLEVKDATWQSMQFAEAQLLNYVSKGNRSIREVERHWRARGHPADFVTSVRGMPTARYQPSDQPETIEGQRVLLGWCRRGVILFKTLDESNEEIVYCGISDKGRTDAFLNRLFGPASDAVARALARRLNELGLGPVNVKLLIKAVRDRLQSTIRYFLEESFKAVCAAVVEVTAAAVFAEFKRRLLNKYFVDLLAGKFASPKGETGDIPVAEVTGAAAIFLTIVGIILEYGPILAF